MSIIVYTDFVGQISIPNSAPSNTEGANLALFIAKYEAKYLTDVLGYKMAKDFVTAIALAPTSGVWFDLWKGAEFTDTLGRLNKWCGFRNADSLLAIANYIYVQYIEQTQTNTTGLGEKATATTNAVPATPIWKVCQAWNDMVDLNRVLNDFLTVNADDYPDYVGFTSPLNLTAGYGTNDNFQYFKKRNLLGI